MNILPLAAFNFSSKETLIVLAVLAAAVLIWKFISSKKKSAPATENATAETVAVTENATEADAESTENKEPVYTGYVTLDSISEQDAAVVMAITSHKTGIPLERLGFCSIKLKGPELTGISEQDAAAVMAITSHRTGIPLENLYFKSIRLMED